MTHRFPTWACPGRKLSLCGSWASTREEQKPPGDGPCRGPQVFLGPMVQQPYTSRGLTGLAFLPGEDVLGTKVLGPEPQPSSSPNQEAR